MNRYKLILKYDLRQENIFICIRLHQLIHSWAENYSCLFSLSRFYPRQASLFICIAYLWMRCALLCSTLPIHGKQQSANGCTQGSCESESIFGSRPAPSLFCCIVIARTGTHNIAHMLNGSGQSWRFPTHASTRICGSNLIHVRVTRKLLVTCDMQSSLRNV